VLEARDRVGGRIWTHREPGSQTPIELGAEFIDGITPGVEEAIASAGARVADTGGDAWTSRDGRLTRRERGGALVGEIFEKLHAAARRGPDMSLAEFLARECADERFRDSIPRAVQYVCGYHAAHPERIGIQGLVFGDNADDEIQGDRTRRALDGYDGITDWLRAQLPPDAVRFNTPVSTIEWRPGLAYLHTERGTLSAPQVVITVPLPILKEGAIRFTPRLADKDAAMQRLHMGSVTKLILRFDAPFWVAKDKRLARLGWLSVPDHVFRAWWTRWPADDPVLVGWVGGPNGQKLAELLDEAVLEKAVEGLAGALALPTQEVRTHLRSWHLHNWERDPYFRGAYSYLGVGGLEAQRVLAAPVEGTLFFAGEATDVTGHFSTVHGALATGYRAAREALAARDASSMTA